jgi:CheY-like chemotaxis protein
VLPQVVHLAEALAFQHRVRLELQMAEGLPLLPVHEVALSQALLNLLGAVIPCVSCGGVSVSARRLSAEVEIRIEGTKPPADPRSALRQPVPAADVRCLDLAQQLVQLCKGRLTLASHDSGLMAVLTIPGLEQIPVLVIDDNADTLQLLRRYAVGTRYNVVTVQDPAQALSLAESLHPKIIVLDVMMPRIDGWRVLAGLRQHPPTERIPIVVCTILPQEEMAFALGASGFVQKPVTRQAFLSALDRQVALMETESR